MAGFLICFGIDSSSFMGVAMKEKETKQYIDQYSKEIEKYQSLSRSLMSRDEMIMVDNKIIQLKGRIKNLRSILSS